MTTTPAVLIAPKLAENSTTLQYTSDNCTTAIDKFTAVNVTGSNATITVYLVEPDGSASSANTITLTKTVAPGRPWLMPEAVGHMLNIGGTIWTNAGTASAISIRASGRRFT
jgi:hypothetical protein